METQEEEKEIERRNIYINKNKEQMKRSTDSKREQGLGMAWPFMIQAGKVLQLA